MSERRNLLIILLFLITFSAVMAQPRREVDLHDGWLFSRDSAEWQAVTVPHDWAISGPFDKKWDLQKVAITQNGETEETEKSGRSGALPWIGRGFYKTKFTIPAGYERAVIHFDGAMAEPNVYVNGRKVGYWPYGYNAFELDLTPYVRFGGAENELAVSLTNVEESSRWYPGAGIYRPVTLILTGRSAINRWGTYLRTLSIGPKAQVSIDTKIDVAKGDEGLTTQVQIFDKSGNLVATATDAVAASGQMHRTLTVTSPHLWSPESPYLYNVVTTLLRNGIVIDKTTDRLGIRTVSVSREHGFQLNGATRKIKGVCLHHDLGPLGAAVNRAAIIRQVRLLKDMGADAIRTSHNMPSAMQMQVYDSLGMMVMAESFDMWHYPKCKNGYSRFFNEWGERDITNLVLNHRNHPSLVMWSIGNEIPEQGSADGRRMAQRLQTLCHELDPSRPVTQGLDRIDNALKSGFAQVMDVPGFNYRVYKYGLGMSLLPQGFLLGSETASTVSSRGVYKFPVVWSNNTTYPDGQVNGYDTQWCSWSNLPEEDFMAQDDNSYTIGQFVWTGFDYLGEPTPYDTYWPSRSSYFGICDLAGLPKDRFYLYRSQWNKREHTLHLLPHWTWPGRKGELTPVFCYTDYPEAELFVNGKSQGRISKDPSQRGETATGKPATSEEAQQRARRYRLMWDNVKYEPGELTVVAYDKNGSKAAQQTVRTAGKPTQIVLEPDREAISADGQDISFITVSLADKSGNLVPTADDELEFEVSGCGHFKAVCNGDATGLEPFTEPKMKLFSGKLVLLVQSSNQTGEITVRVSDKKRHLSKSLIVRTI